MQECGCSVLMTHKLPKEMKQNRRMIKNVLKRLLDKSIQHNFDQDSVLAIYMSIV